MDLLLSLTRSELNAMCEHLGLELISKIKLETAIQTANFLLGSILHSDFTAAPAIHDDLAKRYVEEKDYYERKEGEDGVFDDTSKHKEPCCLKSTCWFGTFDADNGHQQYADEKIEFPELVPHEAPPSSSSDTENKESECDSEIGKLSIKSHLHSMGQGQHQNIEGQPSPDVWNTTRSNTSGPQSQRCSVSRGTRPEVPREIGDYCIGFHPMRKKWLPAHILDKEELSGKVLTLKFECDPPNARIIKVQRQAVRQAPKTKTRQLAQDLAPFPECGYDRWRTDFVHPSDIKEAYVRHLSSDSGPFCDSMSQEILAYFLSTIAKPEQVLWRDRAAWGIQSVLNRVWKHLCEYHAKFAGKESWTPILRFHGSAAVVLDNKRSDIDLGIDFIRQIKSISAPKGRTRQLMDEKREIDESPWMTHARAQELLQYLGRVLSHYSQEGLSFQVSQILQARVPVLRLKAYSSQLKIDLTVWNPSCSAHTRLLQRLLAWDVRVYPFFAAIKRWAQARSVYGARHGRIGGYGLMLLGVYSLQVVRKEEGWLERSVSKGKRKHNEVPSMLPPLECWAREATLPNLDDKEEYGSTSTGRRFRVRDKRTLSELLFSFFGLFSSGFNPDSHGLSVRQGKRVLIDELMASIKKKAALIIEDPVYPSHNVALSLCPKELKHLRNQLRKAHLCFKETASACIFCKKVWYAGVGDVCTICNSQAIAREGASIRDTRPLSFHADICGLRGSSKLAKPKKQPDNILDVRTDVIEEKLGIPASIFDRVREKTKTGRETMEWDQSTSSLNASASEEPKASRLNKPPERGPQTKVKGRGCEKSCDKSELWGANDKEKGKRRSPKYSKTIKRRISREAIVPITGVPGKIN